SISGSACTLTTVAALGAVRLHPLRSSTRSSASAMDAQREDDQPDEPDHLEHAVREHDLLGGTATALVDDQRVTQHGDDERHDRQTEPGLVTGVGCVLERP